MLRKRATAISAAILLCFGILAGMTGTTEVKAQENTKAEKIQHIVESIKERIEIPEEYTEFTYETEERETGITYYFNWRSSDDFSSTFVVSDEDANIISCNSYQSGNDKQADQLNYLMDELKEEAKKQIIKLNPCMEGHLGFESGQFERYPYAYRYTFNRVENGIIMENQVSISLSTADKSLVSFNADWLFSNQIPQEGQIITKTKAAEAAKKELKLSLKYITKSEWNQKERKVDKSTFLAYVPSVSYLSVDALSGKVSVTDKSSEYYYENASEEKSAQDTETGNSSLTPEELEEISKIDTLLSKEEAAKIITLNQSLYLYEGAELVSGALYKEDDTFYWNLSFAQPLSEKNQGSSFTSTAKVDAKTGRLLSFSTYLYDRQDIDTDTVLLSEKTGAKRAESFIRAAAPEYVNQLKKQQDGQKELYREVFVKESMEQINYGFRYQYIRMVNEIPYEDNGIEICIDRVTGKVYRYFINWDSKLTFADPANIISAGEAVDSYLKGAGFRLVYEDNIEEDQLHNVCLVYNTRTIGNYYISPETGSYMNYEGEEIDLEKKQITYFTDLWNSPYARSIKMLADIGYGYQNGRFYPYNDLTLEEMFTMLNKANFYLNEEQKEMFTARYVTREVFAKALVCSLRLDGIAKYGSIFITGYKDEDQISQDAKGSVAILKGLGVWKAEENSSFMPKTRISRGEAADLIVKLSVLQEK